MRCALLRPMFSWRGAFVSRSVCLSVNAPTFCKSRCADRGPVSGGDSWSLRNIVLDGDTDFRHGLDAAFAKLLWQLVIITSCPTCALYLMLVLARLCCSCANFFDFVVSTQFVVCDSTLCNAIRHYVLLHWNRVNFATG